MDEVAASVLLLLLLGIWGAQLECDYRGTSPSPRGGFLASQEGANSRSPHSFQPGSVAPHGFSDLHPLFCSETVE